MKPVTAIEWLLDSDPSIRWQVMRDLLGEPEEAIAAERAKVATEGWGERLLALQGPDGQWGKDVLPESTRTSGEGLPDVATRNFSATCIEFPSTTSPDFSNSILRCWRFGRTNQIPRARMLANTDPR